MAKLKNGIREAALKEKEEQQKQEDLRKKYKVDNKEVMIVEKNNMIKFFLRVFYGTIRIAATIIILLLAAIGLLSLLYPEIRTEFLVVIKEILSQLKIML